MKESVYVLKRLSTNKKTSRRALSDFETRTERESFESDKVELRVF